MSAVRPERLRETPRDPDFAAIAKAAAVSCAINAIVFAMPAFNCEIVRVPQAQMVGRGAIKVSVG